MLRNRKLSSALAALLFVGIMAACGGGDTDRADDAAKDTTAGQGRAGAGKAVEMRLIALRPEKLSVSAGNTVTWTQRDPGVHTVTSGTVIQEGGGVRQASDGKFDSGQIPTSATFQHKFETTGVFPYFCAIHPATMRGEITVT